MAAGGPDKRTCIRTSEKTRGVRRGWKCWQKTDRRIRALEEDNDDGDIGWKIFRDNGDGGRGWRRGGDAGQGGTAKDGEGR